MRLPEATWTKIWNLGYNLLTLSAMTEVLPDNPFLSSASSITIYTSSKVVDSQGRTGCPVELTHRQIINSPSKYQNVSDIQFLHCSRSLILQHGQVMGSGEIIPSSLQPAAYKTDSEWNTYNGALNNPSNETTLLRGDSASGAPHLFLRY